MAQIASVKSLPSAQRYPASSRILMSGKAFVADVSGALYWPAEETLIVSDLAFGHSTEEEGLPPAWHRNRLRSVLSKLSALTDKYNPARLIVVGDSLPSAEEAGQIASDDIEKLRSLQEKAQWCWIGEDIAESVKTVVGGEVLPKLNVTGITFRDRPILARVCHEIAGGMRPTVVISKEGKSLRGRCFASTGTRLVLPAFVDPEQGTNVINAEFSPLFAGEMTFIWMLGWSEVFPVAAAQLLEDQ